MMVGSLGQLFAIINTLARPAESTRSTRDNHSVHECCFRQSEHVGAPLARAKGYIFSPFKHSLNLTWLGGSP